MKSKILLIEDDQTFFDCVSMMLSDRNDVGVVWAKSGAHGIKLYQQDPQAYAVVILDYILPDFKGTEVCQHLRRINPEQEFLFASGHSDPAYLLDQLETGSSGFLIKGSPISEMKNKVLSSIIKYQTKNRLLNAADFEPTKAELELKQHGFISRSQIMLQMLKEIESAKNSPYPTLIIGETGTGKELIARALVPKGKKIISINCASFLQRENLLEAELFGYVKGAFTGANTDTVGLVTKANQNVLFLDELHQLPLAAQAKLLRFLQEMKFRKVGDNSDTETKVSFKLVAAVQPDIKERLRDKSFLTDLFERVGTLIINAPSLREKPEDIELLVRHFQDEYNKDKTKNEQKLFRISTVTEMQKQSWLTNIRGLQNAVKQMMTNCESDIVNLVDFKNYLSKVQLGGTLDTSGISDDLLSADHDQALKNFETKRIIDSLKKSKTRSEAAIKLGLPLSTLVRKINQLGIDPSFYLTSS